MAFRGYEKSDSMSYKTVEQLYKSSQASYAQAGGFLLEDDEEEERKEPWKKFTDHEEKKSGDPRASSSAMTINGDVALSPDGYPLCSACQKEFPFSFLLEKFDHLVCDKCREEDKESYRLITRTEAKNQYLLKDCDFDSREPTLRFVSKKNPHNPRWGEMKLYLRLQVEKRALEVWGDLEGLEEAKQKKDSTRSHLREKRFEKKLKEMRQQVRGDLQAKKRKTSHVHDFGEETYDSDSDLYSQKCKTCDHVNTYEKM